jgi:hypothetical protein
MPATIYNEVNGEVNPLPNDILVYNMEKGDTVTRGGIILTDDNGTDRGLRPRWCQVYKVGSSVDEVLPGQWILVEHGRWTYGINVNSRDSIDGKPLYLQKIDREAIMLVSEEQPRI